MPRKRSRTVVVPVEIPPETSEETPEQTPEQEEAEAVLAESQSEMPKPPMTWLYRLDQDTQEPKFIGRFAAGSLNEAVIGKRWGGGRFRLVTRKPGPKGGYVFHNQQTLTIDESVRPEAPVVHDDGAERELVMGRSSDFLEKMLLMQMQTSSQLMQAVMGAFASIGARPQPQTDPLMLEVIRASMTRKDPMELATALLGMFRENGASKDPIDQLIRLGQARETLKGVFGDGESDETQWIGKGLELAARALGSGQPVAVPPMTPRAALPAAPGAPALPKAEPASPAALPEEVIDVTGLRAWMVPVAENLPALSGAARFMPPDAAALTMRAQMEATAGVWEDFTADVRTGYADDAAIDADADFPNAFVGRTTAALKLTDRLKDAELVAWAQDTLKEAAFLAVEREEETDTGTDDGNA